MGDAAQEGAEAGTEAGKVAGAGAGAVGPALFGAADYAVFAALLALSAAIGLYCAWRARRRGAAAAAADEDEMEETEAAAAEEELLGGRNLGTVPVALSLIASYVSGVTLLGAPAEVYVYGADFALSAAGLCLAVAVHALLFLPTLHRLRLTSAYEYLELRFDRRVRLLGSVLFVVGNFAWVPIVLYVPALALNQVTGAAVHVITPIVSVVCIFYTTVGGLRAVVWADVAQTVAMVAGMLLVVLKGTADVGGVGAVWARASDGGRLDAPRWTLDPTVRHSVWAVVVGGGAYWLQANAVNQNQAQRYLALPTLRSARVAAAIFAAGAGAIVLLCCYCGLLLYASFHRCDPIASQAVQRPDQLLPLLVTRTLGAWPGLPGLFVAAIFSAALSSMSTALNSLAAVALEDFFRPLVQRAPSAARARLVVRGTVVAAGAASAGLALLVERLGTVQQVAMSLAALSHGPLLGLFAAGLLAPAVDAHGALAGGAAALAATAWVVVGAQTAIAAGDLRFPRKPVSTEGCEAPFNHTVAPSPAPPPLITQGRVLAPYRVSYMWYTLLGCCLCVGVALLASAARRLLVGGARPSPDPRLLSAVARPRACPRRTVRDAADALVPHYQTVQQREEKTVV